MKVTEQTNKIDPKAAHIPKVAFISHSANGDGGAEAAILEIIAYLTSEGKITAEVILPSEGSMSQSLRSKNIKYVIVPSTLWADTIPIQLDEKARRNSVNSRAVCELVDYLKIAKPDVCFTNTITVPWLALAAAQIGIPHVWMIHEFGDLEHGYDFDYPFDETLEIIDRLSSKIVVNSEAVLNHISKKVSKNKITQIYYAMSDNFTDPGRPINHFHNKTAIKCILLGRILPSKGQLSAVKAIDILNRQNIPAELLIMGRAQSQDYVNEITSFIKKNEIEQNISIIEHQPNPERYIAAADVLLMCSENEAFGRVTVEAMLLAKPVIGNSTGGTIELIKNGKTGLLYRQGDILDLASQIKKLAKDKELLEKLGKQAAHYASKTFTHTNSEIKILKVIKSAHASSPLPFIDKFIDYTKRLEVDLRQSQNDLEATRRQLYETRQVLYCEQQRLSNILNSRAWKIARQMQVTSGKLRRRS